MPELRSNSLVLCLAATCVFLPSLFAAGACGVDNTLVANVVALDQPFLYNRLGTAEPQGMIFALERDVVPMDWKPGQPVPPSIQLKAGNVRLRDDKRPRPMVLRVNEGSCLQVNFRNLLEPEVPAYLNNLNLSDGNRYASIHLSGLNLVSTVMSDASFVGANADSVLPPETSGVARYLTYTWYAPAQGTYLLYSTADLESNNQNGQMVAGMFGAVNVEPPNAEYYRSQVTRDGLAHATLSANALPPNTYLKKLTDRGQKNRVTVRRSMFAHWVPQSELNRDLFELTTVDPKQQTFHSVTVVEVPDEQKQPRLYAIDALQENAGHPVVNYFARYGQSERVFACAPVLRMAASPLVASNAGCVPLPPLQVASVSKARAAVISTTSANRLSIGSSIAIRNATGDWAALNGVYPVAPVQGSTTSFSIPVDSSSFNGNFNGTLEYPTQLYYSDLTALITGPNAGVFPYSDVEPSFNENPAEPNRREPFREFTIHYHNPVPVQPFPQFSNKNLSGAYSAVTDSFAINYGIAGIGAEILANRLQVGPEGNADAVDLKFEEFFLSSWAVGDPAIVVDSPANGLQSINPADGGGAAANGANLQTQNSGTFSVPPSPPAPIAKKAFYPDDPSNVYHSYIRDHVKFRVLHAGPAVPHVHHLHAHQWLRTPNSDDGHYLDSQMITPGSAFTLEIAYGGSGNRNLTPGDSIFHCHFYPHFAGGMWGLWRVHDVFETGTTLDPKTGIVAPGINRALPDGEITNGTPIPAIVPVPTLAMAPMPADVALTKAYVKGDGRRVCVLPDGSNDPAICDAAPAAKPPANVSYSNPGFPFFVPGVAGHRPPHPPLDFAWKIDDAGRFVPGPDGKKQYLNGGLPRHVVLGGKIYREAHTRWDFTKDFVLYGADHKTLLDGSLTAYVLPEEGTSIERAAMAYHARRAHHSFLPNGDPGNFITNGVAPRSGAPFAPPGVTDGGNSNINNRRYMAAAVQMNVVLNKNGWHFPQQRMLTLWEDVKGTVDGDRPPQPFFIRANTGETVEYWHTNLVPNYYELDDFQVRTPTDILGQHIHLVKFDVLASDGAENGFNYEDGTFSPDEVRERIFAITHNKNCAPARTCGLLAFDDGPRQFFKDQQFSPQPTVQPYRTTYARGGKSIFGDPPFGQDWDGAQTTIQLWDTDPLLNNRGFDRTLRTVFTHDHFGPSTHQQAGLYGGLLVEPEASTWVNPDDGTRLYDMFCYDQSGKRAETSSLDCPAGFSRRRIDGGPTSWQAIVKTPDLVNSYREFALEFQDMQLAYTAQSNFTPGVPTTGAAFNFTLTPPALKPGLVTLTPDVVTAFNLNGIPLTPNATVDSVMTSCSIFPGLTSANTWHVHDTNPPDQNQDYCVSTVNPPAGGANANTLWVYTPSIAKGWAQPSAVLTPPTRDDTGLNGSPFPTVISSAQNGTESLNYRNEPIPLRVDPGSNPPTKQAADLSYAFSSLKRGNANLNCQPLPGSLITSPCQAPPAQPVCNLHTAYCAFRFPSQPLVPKGSSGAQDFDPFTPLLRAYQNDNVQIRTLVGAHLNLHSFEVQGVNWLMQPTYPNSGYRSVQGMGLSEHYELLFKLSRTSITTNPFADYLFQANAGTDGIMNGMWGILRSFDLAKARSDSLQTLPNNDQPSGAPPDPCDKAPQRSFSIAAINTPLMYYNRTANGTATQIQDQAAMVYVNTTPAAAGAVTEQPPHVSGSPVVEPLILRAAAGECINITLTNTLQPQWPGPLPAPNPAANPGTFNSSIIPATVFGSSGSALPTIMLPISTNVGLHPQLLYFDVTKYNGTNVGFNPPATADLNPQSPHVTNCPSGAPANSQCYRWFAGKPDGTPVEFGSVLLEPSDPLLQHYTGLVGVLIIEPKGSTWTLDPPKTVNGTPVQLASSASVVKPDLSTYRELVLALQNDIENQNVSNLQGAFNYRTEPVSVRLTQAGAPPRAAAPAPTEVTRRLRAIKTPVDQMSIHTLAATTAKTAPAARATASVGADQFFTTVARYSNQLFGSGTNPIDPQTPILTAGAGDPARMHVVFAGGTPNFPIVFDIHGHSWLENPWIQGSSELGANPQAQTFGMEAMVPFQSSNFMIPSAGGGMKIPGDYLYEVFQSEASNAAPGAWGLLRVRNVHLAMEKIDTQGLAQGTLSLDPADTSQTPVGPVTVTVWTAGASFCSIPNLTLPKAGQVVAWKCQGTAVAAGARLVATTSIGGSATASVSAVQVAGVGNR